MKIVNYDGGFLEPMLRSEHLLNQYKLSSVQGASVVRRNLDMDLFNEIKVPCPSLEEQQKVVNLFARMDAAVALHQRSWTTDPCSNKPGQRSHDQIDVFVLELLDDVEVGSLGCVHG